MRDTLRALRGSHKLAQLVLGNVATEVLFAIALGLFVRGLGFPLSLADLLVINISVSLLSTVIPVPGGIGVVEGGLVVGPDGGRRARVGRLRGGAPVPHLDVLPAADLGLVRAALAAQEPVPLAGMRSGITYPSPNSFLTPSQLAAQTQRIQREDSSIRPRQIDYPWEGQA